MDTSFVTKTALGVASSSDSPNDLSRAEFAFVLKPRRRSIAHRSAHLPFASLTESREPKTGEVFPEQYCHLRDKDCPVLAGVGTRRKRLLGMKNIDVYVLGFYVDAAQAQATLGSRYGDSAAGPSQQLCNDIISEDGIEKTVRIVVTSGLVNHSKFLSGIRESLWPALERTGASDTFGQFESMFEGVQFRRGMEMAFTTTQLGGLAARIDNMEVGSIASRKFKDAFLGLYLGEQPVSQDGKANISTGLAQLLAQKS